jgi:DNA-directed RNA polymerase subunit RPC12/RpoP
MSVISDALKHGHDIYVCAECVKAEGGTAVEGHIASTHDGECRQCGRSTWLTPLTDWKWPGRMTQLRRKL